MYFNFNIIRQSPSVGPPTRPISCSSFVYLVVDVYLFIDKMGNGKYKLIYIKNDDLENSLMDWEKQLGDDFDMSVLDF